MTLRTLKLMLTPPPRGSLTLTLRSAAVKDDIRMKECTSLILLKFSGVTV